MSQQQKLQRFTIVKHHYIKTVKCFNALKHYHVEALKHFNALKRYYAKVSSPHTHGHIYIHMAIYIGQVRKHIRALVRSQAQRHIRVLRWSQAHRRIIILIWSQARNYYLIIYINRFFRIRAWQIAKSIV